MLKCFSCVDRALKFITLAVYSTAIIATDVDQIMKRYSSAKKTMSHANTPLRVVKRQ